MEVHSGELPKPSSIDHEESALLLTTESHKAAFSKHERPSRQRIRFVLLVLACAAGVWEFGGSMRLMGLKESDLVRDFVVDLLDMESAWEQTGNGTVCLTIADTASGHALVTSLEACRARCIHHGDCRAVDYIPQRGPNLCLFHKDPCNPGEEQAGGLSYRITVPLGLSKEKKLRGDEQCLPAKFDSRIQVVMLTLDSELSAWRVRHFLESAPLDVRCLVCFQDGVNKKDYSTPAVWIDENPLVDFANGTKLHEYREDILQHEIKEWAFHQEGWLSCAAGHVAMWKNASSWPGWTIILEDDAVMRQGWGLPELAAMIQSNATETAHELSVGAAFGRFGVPGATPEDALVWLEMRACYLEFGTGAYAIHQKTANYLVDHYHFQAPVDVWLINKRNQTQADEVNGRTKPRMCLDDVTDYPFFTWGENRSVPSEINTHLR